jgi:hypothetical protein
MTAPFFGQVSLAYAEHVADLAAAREIFKGEREKVLAHLEGIVKEATALEPTREGTQREYVSIYRGDSRWGTERRRRGLPDRAGYCFVIGHGLFGEPRMAFTSYVFFEMSADEHRALSSSIAADNIPLSYGNPHARGFHHSVTVDEPDLRIEALEAAVRELPDVFRAADEPITRAFVEAQGAFVAS